MSETINYIDTAESVSGASALGNSATAQLPSGKREWPRAKKLGFRIIFIFFLAMSIPVVGSWYTNLFTINWFRPHYRDIYDIARFSPSYKSLFTGKNENGDADFPVETDKVGATKGKGAATANHAKTNNNTVAQKNPLLDYTDWGIALLIGIIGGLIWTLIDRNRTKAYDKLYYWIRVVVRYRAGIGIIGFGFTKLFPTQMPYPSLGLLNSNFGDFTAQKIYWMSVGIVHGTRFLVAWWSYWQGDVVLP